MSDVYVVGIDMIKFMKAGTGPAVEALSVDERATMTNMAAEVGAFTGIVQPDEKTARFLEEWRGLTRAEAEQLRPDARITRRDAIGRIQ